MRIFYLIADQGDGSSLVHFFTDKDHAEEVWENFPEIYSVNEEGPCHFDVEGDHNIEIQRVRC